MHGMEGPSGQHYHYNGDYSGAVKTFVPVREQTRGFVKDVARAGMPAKAWATEEVVVEVEIPFEDMHALVMDKLRSDLIGFLQMADAKALERFFLRLGPPRDSS